MTGSAYRKKKEKSGEQEGFNSVFSSHGPEGQDSSGETSQKVGLDETCNDNENLLAELGSAREMVESLSEQNRALSETIARARADFFNYRQRVERENERLRATASESAAAALLPVLDNLDRALASNRNDEDPFYKGVEMVRGQFFSVLEGMGVTPVDTVGSPFDPALHEAVATVEAGEGIEDGTITEEIQAGYRIAGRILRAARVKVARAGS